MTQKNALREKWERAAKVGKKTLATSNRRDEAKNCTGEVRRTEQRADTGAMEIPY